MRSRYQPGAATVSFAHARRARGRTARSSARTTAQQQETPCRGCRRTQRTQRAIVQLAINIVAGIDEDRPHHGRHRADPMLEPLDQLRAAQSRRASGDRAKPPTATPTTPGGPEVPAGEVEPTRTTPSALESVWGFARCRPPCTAIAVHPCAPPPASPYLQRWLDDAVPSSARTRR